MNASDSIAGSPDLRAEWRSGKSSVRVYMSRAAMGRAVAQDVGDRIRRIAAEKGAVRIIFAAAPSQAEVLAALVALPDIPWRAVTAFHMDDYLGLPADAPQRFGNWLEAHLFSLVPLGQVHRIPATGEADAICRDYAALLAEAPIDIVCLGIGVNGHIAFNDPPVASFEDPEPVRTVTLDGVCRQQQVDDGCFARLSLVPEQAITLTIPTLMAGDALFCAVPGAHKRQAVRAALEGPLSPACPASILRTHGDCTIYLDPEAAPDG